jgi:hypothetical protein
MDQWLLLLINLFFYSNAAPIRMKSLRTLCQRAVTVGYLVWKIVARLLSLGRYYTPARWRKGLGNAHIRPA